MGLIVDSTRSLSFEEVEKASIQVVESEFSIPSASCDYWFLLKLKNSSSQAVQRLIGFDEVFIETADIYYRTNSGVYIEESGLILPINEPQIKNRCPLFYTNIEANDSLLVYLKLNSKFLNTLNVVVNDLNSHVLKEQNIAILHWFYFGAAISIILYNLVLYFHVREKVYLFYVIYAFCFVFLIFLYSGYSLYIIPSITWHYKLHVTFAISLAFTPLFTRLLLNTKAVSQWIDRGLLIVAVWYLLLVGLILIDVRFYQWLVISGVPASLIVLVLTIICYFKKAPLAGIYLVACGGYIIGLFISAMGSLGMIPYNSFARHAFIVGSLFEFILLSLALGRRYKILHEEKLTFQQQLITTEKEMTSKLEFKVEERTSALNESLEKQRSLNMFKEDLTGMLVHDLKAPLSSVINVKFLNSEEGLSLVQQSGYRMLHLVQNILDVYKYEKVSFELHKTKHSVDEIIQLAISEVSFLASQKNIKIDFSEVLNISVVVDADVLKRVFVNLLSNAIKYSSAGKPIVIKVIQEEECLRFSVVNFGKLIPIEQQQIIFERFGQFDKKYSGDIGSTGLGLTFCKMAIEAHGGQLGVNSEEQKGTEFWFTIVGKFSMKNTGADDLAQLSSED